MLASTNVFPAAVSAPPTPGPVAAAGDVVTGQRDPTDGESDGRIAVDLPGGVGGEHDDALAGGQVLTGVVAGARRRVDHVHGAVAVRQRDVDVAVGGRDRAGAV